jgi:predicted RNase H-like nuclease (RuvC/YqgF family)
MACDAACHAEWRGKARTTQPQFRFILTPGIFRKLMFSNHMSNFRLLFTGLALLLAASPAGAQTIKKCKDAQGKWHYGDTAAEECAQSRVTVIDDQGIKVKEMAVPMTEAELQAHEAAKAKEEEARQRKEARQKEDSRLLASFDSEESIIRSRDERVTHLNGSIEVNQELIEQLRQQLANQQQRLAAAKDGPQKEQAQKYVTTTETQIREYEAANQDKRQQIERIKQRFNAYLERYRELTHRQAGAQAPEQAVSGTVN